MKCFKCGTEYDDGYHFCPLCRTEQPKKKAIMNQIWESVFSLLTIAIYLLALIGVSKLWGDSVAMLLFYPLMILWVWSRLKIKNKENTLRGERIAELLKQYEEHRENGEYSKALWTRAEICKIARDEGPH